MTLLLVVVVLVVVLDGVPSEKLRNNTESYFSDSQRRRQWADLARALRLFLINVLGQPAETLAVSLSLQHGAHKQLQRTAGQFVSGNLALRVRQINIIISMSLTIMD